MSAHKEIIVGIDLGTTNTCAAYYLNGSVRILEDKDDGSRITPSYLFYTEKDKVIVGTYAKKMADKNKPEYGVYEVKRLIGRTFDDHKLQKNLKHLTYIVEDLLNEPVVLIKHPKIHSRKTPVELCTTILSKVKCDIEAKFGKEHKKNVVVSVPAYFNVSQREATLEAANEAGFTVLKLLNEPTAAALRFLLDNSKYYSVNDHFLVYDLGGGTFDVAILKKTEQNIEIVAVDGDNHLGGHDFDNLIVDYLCSVLIKDYSFDPKTDKRKLRRLRDASEEAKKILSTLEKTEVCLEVFVPGFENVELELSREHFEKIAAKLFKKTIDIMDICLRSCNLSKSNIKEVILAGGSTRIPKIQELISNYFDGRGLNRFINPDECVAEGAAIQAAMLSNHPEQKINSISITDVTPLSLGTDIYPYVMDVVIKLHTAIPVSITKTYRTTKNNQTSMPISIYEGERIDVGKNRYLGTFEIDNLTPAPPSQCEVLVRMTIDQNGILTVNAKEVSITGTNTKMLKVVYTRGLTSDFEVRNTLKDAENNKLEDAQFLNFGKLKRYLKNYCQAVLYNISNKFLHKEIYDLCKTIDKEGEEVEVDEEVEIKRMIRLVESKCKFLVKEYNFKLMPEPCDF